MTNHHTPAAMMKQLLLCLSLAAICPAQDAPTIPANVKVTSNLSYAQFPETKLDIYQPQAGTAAGKRTGVLVIHGGGWVGGTKEAVVSRLVLPLVNHGYVVANVEYRLAAAALAPAAVIDVLAAAKWFRDHAREYGVDPNKIVVTGDSAGGHLALMTGMAPKSAGLGPTTKIAAVINWYGITDVEDQLSGANQRDYAVKWMPTTDTNRGDLARRVSPMTYVRKDVPPVLTIHGSADPTVPYEQGVQLTKALRDAKADAEMIPIPSGAHGFPPDQMEKIWPQIFTWLERRKL